MEAFLDLGTAKSNPSCGSIIDLQAQLRDLLAPRVTDRKAEFVTETWEIRSSTVFEVPINQSENEILENASHIDPLLGGVQTNVAPAVGGNGNGNGNGNGEHAATRPINAIDAILNQAADDNALQKILARHIIASLGEVDRSQWIVRQVLRTDQGWTFIYNCKDSCAEWNRLAAKTPAKTAVGEWSEKGGQDPIHLGKAIAHVLPYDNLC